jgi:hypothetical protein
MATRSVRASARSPVSPDPAGPPAAPPRCDLQHALDSFDTEFTNAGSVLHCVVQTLMHADGVMDSDDLVRALNVAMQCSRTFDALAERLDQISLRIAHEGIPAQYGKKEAAAFDRLMHGPKPKTAGGRRHG